MRILLRLLSGVALLSLSAPSHAQRPAGPSPTALCETAIATAEYVGRLPPRLLDVIARVESGRPDAASGRLRPWPWTINAEGIGAFFASKAAAVAAVKDLQARGVQSIDVGCMQVNLAYHPTAFSSLSEAFEPRANALYAARFLNVLYDGDHNWVQAIGAYHSQTPVLGMSYRQRVLALWRDPDLSGRGLGLAAAYRDFAPKSLAYGDFTHHSLAYGAFAISNPALAAGGPLR